LNSVAKGHVIGEAAAAIRLAVAADHIAESLNRGFDDIRRNMFCLSAIKLAELMMPTIQKEEILKILAEKHKIIVNTDDPIFSVFGISDVLYQTYNHAMEKQIKEMSTKFLMKSQAIIKESVVDFRKQREETSRSMQGILQKYQDQLLARCNDQAALHKSLANEHKKSNKYSRLLMYFSLAFFILTVLANIYFVMFK